MNYKELNQDKKLLGVYLIGWLVISSNILLAVLHGIIPATFHVTISSKILSIISIPAVYPWDLFMGFLKDYWLVHWLWILIVALCGADLLRFNKFARRIFIFLNVCHVVVLAYLFLTKLGDRKMLDYFFNLYFNLVVSGTYVGFMTIPEVREKFGIIIEKSLIRDWLNKNQKVAHRGKDPGGYLKLGLAYSRLGRSEDAIEALQKSLDQDTDNVDARFEMGKIFLESGRFSLAINFFKEVIARDPVYKEAYMLLAEALQREGCNEEALKYMEKMIPLKKNDGKFFQGLGSLYHSIGRIDQAIDALSKAGPTKDEQYSMNVELGRIYLRDKENFEKAKTCLQKALKINQDDPSVHFDMGRCHLKLNRFKDALRSFKESLRLDEHNNDTHYQIGFTYAMLKDYASARREYNYLRQNDGDLANTLELLLKS